MSKKRPKKPSKPAKKVEEVQEDFWDLEDDEPSPTVEEEKNDDKPRSKKKSSKEKRKYKKADDKKPEIEDEEFDIEDDELNIDDDEVQIENEESKAKAEELDIDDDELNIDDDEDRIENKEPKTKVEEPKTKDKQPKAKAEKPRTKDKEPETKVDELNIEDEEFDIEDNIEGDEDKIENEKTYRTAESAKTEAKLVRKKESGSDRSKKDSEPTTILEKISLLIVVACLLGALTWGISTFLREAPQGEIVPFKEDYPAKGEFVTIDSVETGWKTPVRSGENADVGVVLESNLIPCAKITLSDGGSATLRVTFRNGGKQLIGDTINLNVENGKFARSGSNTVEIYSTAGFDNASKINSYANGDIDPWALIITEGDSGNEDEPLVKARISADSKDQ